MIEKLKKIKKKLITSGKNVMENWVGKPLVKKVMFCVILDNFLLLVTTILDTNLHHGFGLYIFIQYESIKQSVSARKVKIFRFLLLYIFNGSPAVTTEKEGKQFKFNISIRSQFICHKICCFHRLVAGSCWWWGRWILSLFTQ